ncbi:MAG: alpha amylase C-terminal domain-containing protein [Bacteroidetes bacterium]|nr:alpha amylase C-terminal domain-containing protein [Bacteroidota bacterium]
MFLSFIFISCKKEESKVEYTPSPPEWSKNLSIYELNVRQYTEEGNFAAFEKKLPELKELGVGIIWFMPIHPISELNRKGTLGSYYAVKDYKAVNPEFGSIDEFKALVKKIHDMGMYVIIDWVANHTGWDNVWTETNPDFYSKDSLGNFYPPVPDWSDVIDLNYDNPKLHDAMIDALKFWVKECDIDGYRCDVAAMVPTEFWMRARKELDEIKPIFMLAEASESYLHPWFDMTYNWALKDMMNSIAKGEKNADNLVNLFEEQRKEYQPSDYQMVFTTNHDENSWNGTVFERLSNAVETFAVLCGTVSGMPLIYSGQETGLDKALSFFEKDLIPWKEHRLRKVYKRLNELKKKNHALWNGEAGALMEFMNTDNSDVFSFVRAKNGQKIFAIFNLSPENQTVKYTNNAAMGRYRNLFAKEGEIELMGEMDFELKPWQYHVYVKVQ